MNQMKLTKNASLLRNEIHFSGIEPHQCLTSWVRFARESLYDNDLLRNFNNTPRYRDDIIKPINEKQRVLNSIQILYNERQKFKRISVERFKITLIHVFHDFDLDFLSFPLFGFVLLAVICENVHLA